MRVPLLDRVQAWDWVVPVLLAALAFVELCVMRSELGSAGLALGSDPVLWALEAKNLEVGAPTPAPPLYPLLVSLLDRIRGVTVVDAGLFLSSLCMVLVPPATWWVARRLGAGRLAAAAAGVGVLALRSVVLFGLQVQPDAATVLLLLGAAPVLAGFFRRPSWLGLLGMAVYSGLGWLLREHGLPLAAALAGAAMLAPVPHAERRSALGRLAVRGARPTAIALAVVLAPVVVGQRPRLPWKVFWVERIEMAVGMKGSEDPGAVGDPVHRSEEMAHERAHRERDVGAIVYWHARHSIEAAGLAWIFVALALLAALLLSDGRRLPAIVPLLPSLPGLVVYSQDRHVQVAVPAALAALAAASATRRIQWRTPLVLAIAAIAALLFVRSWRHWQALSVKERDLVAIARSDRAAGRRLCAAASPGDLVAHENHGGPNYGLEVYCPMPHHRLSPKRMPADWKTWYLGRFSPGGGWRPVLELPQARGGPIYA